MRKALTGTALTFCTILLLSGCGQGARDQAYHDGDSNMAEAVSADASGEGASRPPNISPTAAPGVAFDYRYAFRLPYQRIRDAQEQHAAACETLGVERCRIVSASYESDGEDHASGQLAFRLDPMLARKFGNDAIGAVEAAQGILTSSKIEAEDVGSAIARTSRSQAEMEADLRRIEGELAAKGRAGSERAQLQSEAQALRDSLRAGRATQTERRAQLATTPMAFTYQAGETDSSFGGEMTRAFEGFLASLRALLIFFVYALPWLLALLAAVIAAKWINRRFVSRIGQPRRAEPVEPEAPSA
jgi:hypothetical protein